MFDIHQSVCVSGEFDCDLFHEYVHALLEEFGASPEYELHAEYFGYGGYAEMMLDFAGDYLGVTPAKMTPRDMNEIVFELIPRKISTEAENAPAIIAELRAFWVFLQRTYGLKNATPILAILSDAAAARLKRELADPANFGMAKSFVMQGMHLGFDMTTEAGMHAFTIYYNSTLANRPAMFGPVDDADEDDLYVNDFAEGDSVPTTTPKERADVRKKKRKAQRQARKRGRRRK